MATSTPPVYVRTGPRAYTERTEPADRAGGSVQPWPSISIPSSPDDDPARLVVLPENAWTVLGIAATAIAESEPPTVTTNAGEVVWTLVRSIRTTGDTPHYFWLFRADVVDRQAAKTIVDFDQPVYAAGAMMVHASRELFSYASDGFLTTFTTLGPAPAVRSPAVANGHGSPVDTSPANRGKMLAFCATFGEPPYGGDSDPNPSQGFNFTTLDEVGSDGSRFEDADGATAFAPIGVILTGAFPQPQINHIGGMLFVEWRYDDLDGQPWMESMGDHDWIVVPFIFGTPGVPRLRQKQRDDQAPRAALKNGPTSRQASQRSGLRNTYH